MKSVLRLLGMLFAIITLSLSTEVSASFEFVQQRKDAPLIIFVHGLGGSSQSSFASPNGSTWPALMKGDTAKSRGQRPLAEYAIAALAYPASRSDGLRIAQITRGLLDELEDRGVYDSYTEIYIVAHSMGGVIVQDLLTSSNTTSGKQLSSRTRGVFFLAVPAKGAPSNVIQRWAAEFLLGQLVDELRPQHLNSYLQKLEANWDSFLASSGRKIQVYCGYETKALAGLGLIVPQEYATNTRCVDGPRAFNEDHWSIAKPNSTESDVYRWIKGRLASIEISRHGVPIEKPPLQSPNGSPQVKPGMPEAGRAELTSEAILRLLQTSLRQHGCYDGQSDGDWGTESRKALSLFQKRAKLPVTDAEKRPDANTLITVVGVKGPICGCPDGAKLTDGECVAQKKRPTEKKVRPGNESPKPPRRQVDLPDPSDYSLSVWPKGSVPTGQTVSRQTRFGRLVCVGSTLGVNRSCRWE